MNEQEKTEKRKELEKQGRHIFKAKDVGWETFEVTEKDINPGKRKVHPNSLKNLRPRIDNTHMKKMTDRHMDLAKRSREAKDEMMITARALKSISKAVLPDIPNSLTVMKIAMMKALTEDNMSEASRLATIIAEYEQPKLQRTENINTNFDFSDLTDEELQKQIEELTNND